MIEELKERLRSWKNTDDYNNSLKIWRELQPILSIFLSDFSINKIMKMNMDEYAIGAGNRKSFCYYIDQTFEKLGGMSRKTNAYQKFVIYRDKNNYFFGDKRTKTRKGFGSNIDEIYVNIRKELINIIKASISNDYFSIEKNPFNPQFKNKIAYLYNTKEQIPIYSDDDLNKILTVFKIPFDTNEDRAYKREKLYKFYKENIYDEGFSTYMFMCFIYSWYGYLNVLRGSDSPKINSKEINDYELIDAKIDSLIENKNESNATKKRIVYNTDIEVEVSKRITGKKAENIVQEYLEQHKKDLDIKSIKCFCSGENQDDGKGYDISYKKSDGTEIFVEVKATKTNMNNRICFEMSKNEMSFMEKNKESYFVYFINNINKEKIICRISASDILDSKPTPIKYKIDFNSKRIK